MIEKVGVGVAQCGVAVDLEGDVPEADLTALRTWRRPWCRMLCDVERMKILAQGHEHAAMLGILLCDVELSGADGMAGMARSGKPFAICRLS